jgi:3-hydroxyisobutyrate dehydrogenase-like beta-hydroxyacid dehydrogenase
MLSRREDAVTRIALIGTGLLGSGMARRFLKSGTPVAVWNRTAAKARALESEGAAAAASAADAATHADHVHLVLSEDTVVDDVLEQIAPALQTGAIVVDHSTTLPEGTKRRFERMHARGVRFLHAPVFMSPQMAFEGKGLMMISGPRDDYDTMRAELEGMTGEAWYLGERPDLAAAYKLFGNAMLFAVSGGMADVVTMATANAIDPVEAMSVFSKFPVANSIAFRGPKMARGETTPASFELSMARKDVRLMTEAARGRPLVVLPAIATRMDEAIAAGKGRHDLAALGGPGA